ncbi:unnamed protein product [Plasmodium vivax]|uniref:(malaria parasite P. vivax) hypothetical protein n=1 Tax=Plasmodium vivax TaxID=5855 RepID=A0A8S4H853_PLAVI|nr:unnamed protein product [Plasmodium vivax]
MTEQILDFYKWIKEYPFLKDVWNTYDQLDHTVEYDTYKHNYVGVCQKIIELSHGDIKKHKNVCMKLLRNLGHYSHNLKILNFKSEDCTNLNNWVYNSMKKYDIPDKIITECFDDYKTFMGNTNNISRCSYYSYDDMYEEPMNIIILDIFQSNMNIVRKIVDSENNQTEFPMQKYICECVKIYKEMNRKYCPKSITKSDKSNNTCDMLNTFKGIYKSFLSATQHKNYNIPSLDNVEAEYLTMCTQDNSRSILTRGGYGTVSAATSLNGGRDGDTAEVSPYEGAMDFGRDSFTPFTGVDSENQVNPMSRTVSTAVGTVAGASSVLALLYKFSPARRWVHSGIRGNSGRMNSNLYGNEPNELLFDGFQGEDMSSHNTRYNIGYGSV